MWVVTWPLPSTLSCTSMRPSSGGVRLMSNWFEPARALDAIATARPAIGTAAAGAEAAVAVAASCVAAGVVTKPNVGRPLLSVLGAALTPPPLSLFERSSVARR